MTRPMEAPHHVASITANVSAACQLPDNRSSGGPQIRKAATTLAKDKAPLATAGTCARQGSLFRLAQWPAATTTTSSCAHRGKDPRTAGATK